MATAPAALLEGLNEVQARAVLAPDGPLLIFAGAGSGKTRVLTHRIAHVVGERGVRPHHICAVTFTNRAAREMRGRVEQLLGGASVAGMWLGTFHAIGVRMLRRDGEAIGIPSNFVIYDEADRTAALKRAMAAQGIDEKRFSAARVGHAISRAKNELLTPETMEVEGHADAVAQRVFRAYERELRAAGALDFDDLLGRTVALLREAEPVREHFQDRFRHVFVDEYQDINRAQYVLVSLLSARHRNITVVGDDDQSIYGWRGADVRNILSFRRDHPDATVVTLEQNYRSTQPILDIAHHVISANEGRAAKRLWTDLAGGEGVRLVSAFDEQEEALAVAGEIERLVAREGISLGDCAVLYRTNAQSRAFEDILLRRGIPYQLVGGLRFYERREVKDVLAYLRLVANPRDPLSFSRIVNVPRRKIGARTLSELERIAAAEELSPLAAIAHLGDEDGIGTSALSALRSFAHLMERLHDLASRVPLPALLDRVLVETGYGESIRDRTPEGEERWANVLELSGLASEYADVPPPDGLHQFLENVALVSDVDSLQARADAVTLITLHQVKGLEFPVVFLAGMEEGLLPHLRSLQDGEAGLAEERRLAYVGVTRAKRRLYLLHAFRRHLYGSSTPSHPSQFLSLIPPELLLSASRRGGPGGSDPRAPGAVRRAIAEHAIRPNPVAVAPQRFDSGMRVGHPRFGSGTILKSTMTRSGEEVVVRFDDAGVKMFSVSESALSALA